MLMPTTQPGMECPAEVNSSADDPFLKNEQPNTTTPSVNTKKMIKSTKCIMHNYFNSIIL